LIVRKHALQDTQNYCHQCGFLTALECIKFVFDRGSAPGSAGGAYSACQTLTWFKGALLLRRREERGRGKGKIRGEEKGRGGKEWGRTFLDVPLTHDNHVRSVPIKFLVETQSH